MPLASIDCLKHVLDILVECLLIRDSITAAHNRVGH